MPQAVPVNKEAGNEPSLRWPGVLLLAALGLVALAWAPIMQHPTYLRECLLVVLGAPAAALGVWMTGGSRASVSAAVAGRPARLFLAGAWGLALSAWASLLWTSSLEATLPRAVELTALALWGSGWCLAAGGPGGRKLLAGHFSVGALIVSVGCAAYVLMAAQGSAPARLGAPIGNPNTVAVLAVFPLLGAAALLCRRRGTAAARWDWPLRIAAAVVLLLALAAMWLAGSRSGAVALGVGLFVLILLRVASWRLRLGMVAVAALLVVAAAFWLTRDSARLARIEEQVKLTSVGARYYGAATGLETFRGHPLVGTGAGTFLNEAAADMPRERYLNSYADAFEHLAHNEWVQTAAEQGVLGLLALLALFAGGVWGAVRAMRASADDWALPAALAAGICAVAVASLADPSLRFWDFTGFFYAGLGLAAAAPGAARENVSTDAASAPDGKAFRIAVAAVAAMLAAIAAMVWAVPDGARDVHVLRGLKLIRVEQSPALARKEFELAARAPGNFLYRVQGRWELVNALGKSRENVAALEEARKLDAMVPGCPQTLRLLATALLANGDRQGALLALVEAGRRDPYDHAFMSGAGRRAPFERRLPQNRFVSVLMAEPEAGRGVLVAAVAARGALNDGDRKTLESLSAAASGDWDKALAFIDGLAPTGTDFLPLGFWRGVCLYGSGRPEMAADEFARYIRSEPLDSAGWYWRAVALSDPRANAGIEEVAALFRRCVELDIENDAARLELARLMLVQRQFDQVGGLLRPRLAVTKYPVDFALFLAQAAYGLGQKEEARRTLKAMQERSSDPRLQNGLDFLDGKAPAASKPQKPAEEQK